MLPKGKEEEYESSGLEIQPYRKKPRITDSTLLELDHPRRLNTDVRATLENVFKMDIIWMLDVFTNTNKDTLMWVGWNAELFTREEEKQQIWYLPQINLSPTSNAVVMETMKRSLSIAQECNRNTIAVTYALAIAKIALQIQHEESPNFDQLFVSRILPYRNGTTK